MPKVILTDPGEPKEPVPRVRKVKRIVVSDSDSDKSPEKRTKTDLIAPLDSCKADAAITKNDVKGRRNAPLKPAIQFLLNPLLPRQVQSLRRSFRMESPFPERNPSLLFFVKEDAKNKVS
jgi:hypothetical protein